MNHILAERIEDCHALEGQYFDRGVLWPSGDVVLIKSTKRSVLTLSNAAKLPKNRKPRGRNGLTSYGARVVRSAATLLEDKYGRKNLSFLTTTIPDLSDESLDECILKWGQITHQFLKELERHLMRFSLKLEYILVTEIQTKRWLRTGKAYPHLHLIIRGRHNSRQQWVLTNHSLSRIWKRTLESVLHITFSQAPRTGAESIKKTACGYISKYLSKGMNSLRTLDSNIPIGRLPSSWYGCTRKLLSLIADKTVTLRNESVSALKLLIANFMRLHSASYSQISVFDDQTGFSYPVAIIAYIYDKTYRDFIYDCLCDC